MQRVRIFISSPGDVADERNRALEVVKKLQGEFADTLELDPLLWEHEPLLASADFQSQIRSPEDFDIFATIIGGRLGSPLGDRFTRDDGSRFSSGTEFEFELALNSFHAKGSPELLVYRKSVRPDDSRRQQLDEVNRFFEKWFLSAADRTAVGAYHGFDTPEHFAELFTLHLRKMLRRFLPRPNNIPTPISSFVGRRQLLQDAQQAVTDINTRLTVLLGPGGTGKTRLSMRIARQVLPEFDDGVFFIPLADLRLPDLLPNTIAANLDIKQGESQSMLDSVIAALRNKEMLLVIDNLEQVTAAATHISKLLSGCAKLKVLATSRAALRVTGAKTIQVPPLSLPVDAARLPLDQLRQVDAIALFVERAQTARPDFNLTAENSADVVEICGALDGLPLAIELATARLRSMDLSRLLRSMEKRFAVLKGGADDLLDHQRSLRELVAWSYELLSEDEQTLWRRMSIFTGGFYFDAAEEVCDPDDDFIVDIEVESLADQSLCRISFDEALPRVTMLGTLREFALHQLQEVGEFEAVRDRFCDWATSIANDAYDKLFSHEAEQTFEFLDREHTNLKAAIGYAQDNPSPAGAATAVTIATGVWYHWFDRGYLADARTDLASAADESIELAPLIRARALRALASISRFQNDLELAGSYANQALALFQSLDDRGGCADAVGELGATAISRGDLTEAARQLDEALSLRKNLQNDSHRQSFLLATRGVVEHLAGKLDTARDFYERALHVGSQAGDKDSVASAMVNMGELDEAAGNIEAAYGHYRNSLELFLERGKKVAIAYCVEEMAGLSINHLNRPTHAALLFGFADALRTEIGSPIETFNEKRRAQDLQKIRDALNEEAFLSSWQSGATMQMEEFFNHMDDYVAVID
jgi:predicted ATPase